MKTLLIAVASGLLGCLIGVVSTTYWHHRATWSRVSKPTWDLPTTAESGPQPKVEVDRQTHNFGILQRGEERSHTFRFRNTGEAPLELRPGGTSCTCTISKLQREKIHPGDATEVTVTWTATTLGKPVRHGATILTNDPRRPTVSLTVEGVVEQPVTTDPASVAFSRVPVGEMQTAQVRLTASSEANLQVLGHAFTDKALAKHFDVALEPLPAAELADSSAMSGLLVTVMALPGLPVGYFHQGLELTTNVAAEPQVVVPIVGHVGNDLSIVGRGWNPTVGVLSLGAVNRSEGARRELSVFIHGEQAARATLRLVSVWPEVLRVTVGEKQQLKQGTLVKVPLVIEVPEGSPPSNHLGSSGNRPGEILIGTNHPRQKQLRLAVQFAVE